MKEGTIGEVAASVQGGSGSNGSTPDRPRALVFMRSVAHDPEFLGLASTMLEREHDVVLVAHERGGRPGAAVEDLSKRYPQLDQLRLPQRRDPWRIPASATRRSLDYLRFLEPEREDAARFQAKARERAPRLLRALLRIPPFRWRFGRRALAWILRRLEAGLPIAPATKALIRERSPAMIILSRDAAYDPEADLIRSAHARRIPAVLVLRKADLDGPGDIRDVPSLVVVARQEHVNEVVLTYGLPRERVQAVGEAADGGRGPSPGEVVDAVDQRDLAGDVPRPPGRLLRPVLWLLTPLLLILLVLLRPGATLRAIGQAPQRARKRIRRTRRERAHKRAMKRKARGKSTKQDKRARAEALKQRKGTRATEKQRKRERREAAKRRTREAEKQGETTPAAPAEAGREQSE
jgi:hypothetical protein